MTGVGQSFVHQARRSGKSRASLMRSLPLMLAFGALPLVLPIPAAVAQTETSAFNLPAQPLKAALLAFHGQSRVQILIPDDLVEGRTSSAVVGTLSNEQALKQLLSGTGLSAEFTSPRSARLMPPKRESINTPVPTVGNLAAVKPLPMPPPLQMPEEIIVTGTRIRGAAPVGSEVITISRNDIERAGYTTTQDAVRSLPQNVAIGPSDSVFNSAVITNAQNQGVNTSSGSGANIRGLGSDATLTLINGRRVAPSGQATFVDLSQIPISAVQRIEVLADGASAIYGSDAVGGVVNVILRSDFEGAETNVRYSFSDGFDDRQIGQLFGLKWAGGHALLTYDYRQRGSLSSLDRSFITNDLVPLGGTERRTTNSNPGNIVVSGRTYPIPANQDGRNLTPSSLVQGTPNRFSNVYGDILPRQTQHNVFVSAEQDLGGRIHLFGDGRFNYRKNYVRQSPPGQSLTVPSSNAFFVSPTPGVQSETVQYNFLYDLGPSNLRATTRSYTANVGVTIDITDDWSAELSSIYSRETTRSVSGNLINTPALRNALADSSRLTAFNPFGAGSNTNPATIESIRGYTRSGGTAEVKSATAKADGPLFKLWQNDVRAAVGSEIRHDFVHTESESRTSTLAPTIPREPTNIGRTVRAVFGEVLIPAIDKSNRLPGVEKLEFSGAARYEEYSDFGSSTNPRAGVQWTPLDGVTVRGTYGTSFKAPILSQLDRGIRNSFLQTIPDPRSPTGTTQAIVLGGNNPGLKPETATTWSMGLDIRPAIVPGLDISLTRFNIDYSNRIALITDPTVVLVQESVYGKLVSRNPSRATVQALQADPFFTSVPIDPASVGAIVDARFNNLNVQKVRGIDLAASYVFPVGESSVSIGLAGTFLDDYSIAFVEGLPAINHVSKFNYPSNLKLRGSLGWSRENLTATAFVNYTGGYTNDIVTPNVQISSWTTVDLTIRYADIPLSVAPGLSVSLTITNLLNESPPFANAFGGFDPVNASPIGRVVGFQVTKRW